MGRLKKMDGRSLKRTGRTKQWNLKTREAFYQLVYKLAEEENCLMIEILEKAVGEYINIKKKDDDNTHTHREREREREREQN
ncbi:MAG: hypothetical protein MRERV_12c036 [Mycoplasmataceae bacterium RV_VA103A]|nr:MAG: hypothetical protein MRERV_12c036 [Mycoplasmataceae bacterium RV_VA103A]